MADREPSVRTLLGDAAHALRVGGVASPDIDAEALLAHSVGVDRGRLVLIDRVEADAVTRFAELVARRAAREPLQHLIGSAPFRYLDLAVGPGVFVPRPETELLVDAMLPSLRGVDHPVVVDLCAGSGALGLAIVNEVPPATGYAVERSSAALTWLHRNAVGTGLHVVAGDVRDPALLRDLDGRVDAVVSNPPYVPSDTAVGAEVAHDPAVAVFAGADGLDLIPAVVATASRLLRAGGMLALEHDESHDAAVVTLLGGSGAWADVRDHHDLAGRPRYVTALRTAS